MAALRLFLTARKFAPVLVFRVTREKLFITRNMAQKTITSFFKAPRKTVDEIKPNLDESDEKSDEEKTNSLKKKNPRRISDSEDEKSTDESEKHEIKSEDEKNPEKELKTPSKTRKRKPSVKKEAKNTKKRVKNMKNNEKSTNSDSESDSKSQNEDSNDLKITFENYNPNQTRYDSIKNACWSKGEKVPYVALAKTFAEIEKTSGRLKMIEILSNYFRSVIELSPQDLLPSIYLSLNQLAPAYEALELGIGDTVVIKAIADATGRSVDKLKVEFTSKGDLGDVAEASRSNQRMMFEPPRLLVNGVFKVLKDIAKMTGNASMNKKVEKIRNLLVSCRGSESRYIVRSLGGKLRIGLAEQSLLVALARAIVLTDPENIKNKLSPDNLKEKTEKIALILKTTYCECPNYDKIVDVLLKYGVDELPNYCKIIPGIPLKPMLAQPTNGVENVLKRFDDAKFTCEFKYDGERAQIHVTDDCEVMIYSRNQENNTSKYPDVVKRITQMLEENTKSCIIDAEAVAWDPEKKLIRPFQILSTRKRKDANESEIKVQVCIFAFDLLYLNGQSLTKKPLIERRSLLHQHFKQSEGQFVFVKSLDSTNTEQIAEFLDDAISGNCEGLMVKTLESEATYEIAKRSRNWLKLKKDYLQGIGDTLDLVVIGGYHGKGKRKGTYGGFLLACYDDEKEEYQTICKLGTGFKDHELEEHKKFFENHILEIPKTYYVNHVLMVPDVWFDCVRVWEVKCADLSLSPIHTAAVGLVDESKGISLRFPRFEKIREDKKADEATTAAQVADLYRNQKQIKNDENEDEEDY